MSPSHSSSITRVKTFARKHRVIAAALLLSLTLAGVASAQILLGCTNDGELYCLSGTGNWPKVNSNFTALARRIDSLFITIHDVDRAVDGVEQSIVQLKSQTNRVTTATATMALNGYESTAVTAQCPTGMTAISGGFQSNDGYYARCVVLQESYSVGTGWTVRARRHDMGEAGSHCPATSGWTGTVSVVCLARP